MMQSDSCRCERERLDTAGSSIGRQCVCSRSSLKATHIERSSDGDLRIGLRFWRFRCLGWCFSGLVLRMVNSFMLTWSVQERKHIQECDEEDKTMIELSDNGSFFVGGVGYRICSFGWLADQNWVIYRSSRVKRRKRSMAFGHPSLLFGRLPILRRLIASKSWVFETRPTVVTLLLEVLRSHRKHGASKPVMSIWLLA